MKQMLLSVIIVTYHKIEYAFKKYNYKNIYGITKTRKLNFTSVVHVLASAYL